MNPFLFSAICIFFFMCFMYMVAFVKRDNGVADVGWGLGVILVAFATYSYYGEHRLHQKLMTYIIMIWGSRLSFYILIRNWGKPEDFRYANMRKEWGNQAAWRSFLQVFMLQGLVMYILTWPIVINNSTHYFNHDYKVLYPLGSAIGFIGFLFEAISDWQMYNFKSNPARAGRVMNKGLWRYSRHPNYFGEALQWWAIFIMAIPSGRWYLSVLSPLTITWLLLKVSGVTLLEKKYDGNDEYTEYKRTTSAFIPWLPAHSKATEA